jgi:hypothetical protein
MDRQGMSEGAMDQRPLRSDGLHGKRMMQTEPSNNGSSQNGDGRGGYIRIDRAVLRDHGRELGATGVAVYNALVYHAWDGICRKERKAIADLVNVSERAVTGIVAKLQSLGLLTVETKAGYRNCYRLGRAPGARGRAPGARGRAPGARGRAPGARGSLISPCNNTLTSTCSNSSAATKPGTPKAEAERPAAAAGDIGFSSNGKTTRRQDTPGLSPDPEPIANEEKAELVAELVKRGLPAGMASRYVQAADPALIREILAYHEAGKSGWKEKGVGALRSMLEKPEAKWGFERTAEGWRSPQDGSKGRRFAGLRAFAEKGGRHGQS